MSNKSCWDFPSGPVVKTLPSNAGGVGSIPGWGTKIPHAVGCGQKLKKKKKELLKVLLYSTENYIQYPMIKHNGKEYFKKRMYMYMYN